MKLSVTWLESRGYRPLGGMISPDGKYFYLNIPKNASTYLTNVLAHHGWQHHDFNPCMSYDKIFAFVRDPIERWISGFATYAALYICGNNYGSDHFVNDYTELSQRIIFDQVFFDDHTCPQIVYINQIITNQPIFLRYNKNLISQINSLLGTDIVDISVESNKSEENYDTKQIRKFIESKIKSDPTLPSKLVKAFENDYQFINSTNFYDDPR